MVLAQWGRGAGKEVPADGSPGTFPGDSACSWVKLRLHDSVLAPERQEAAPGSEWVFIGDPVDDEPTEPRLRSGRVAGGLLHLCFEGQCEGAKKHLQCPPAQHRKGRAVLPPSAVMTRHRDSFLPSGVWFALSTQEKCRWGTPESHTMWRASFTASCFQVHPGGSVCRCFVPFHGCIIRHCVAGPHFVCLLSVDGHLGCVHSLAGMNNIATNIFCS